MFLPQSPVNAIRTSCRDHGIIATVLKIIRFPFKWVYHRLTWALILSGANEARFTRIYRRNAWNSRESRSGVGSQITNAQNLMRQLPVIFERYQVRRLLDAPCGDFNWMRHVVSETSVTYTGGDIVRDLVARNNALFASPHVRFMHLDITADTLPDADLMIVRDCLFHLSHADIRAFLANFSRSSIPLLLTTSHIGDTIANDDIETGDGRLLNLFNPPLSLPAPLLRLDDYVAPHHPREMCLFSREQLQAAL